MKKVILYQVKVAFLGILVKSWGLIKIGRTKPQDFLLNINPELIQRITQLTCD